MASLEARYREVLTDVCLSYQPDPKRNWYGFQLWQMWVDMHWLGLRTK